ncbi:MAG: dihydropteroate synthase [Gemmatimonadota bacterium]|nr:MAG: dihydropteroate synthase [Gemmatimonadota bacterium]
MESIESMRLICVNTIADAVTELKRIGVDDYSLDIMAPKALGGSIKLKKVSSPAANILKQEMLSLGGDAAVARDVITGKAKTSDVLLMGTLRQFKSLVGKISRQPFGLTDIAQHLQEFLPSMENPSPFPLTCRNHNLDLGARTFIMGVLNVTPDSFSNGGRFQGLARAVDRAAKMVEEGADIIDVGGESTRPGSDAIPPEQELYRTLPVVEKLVKELHVPISVDTYRSQVAEKLLEAGAHMVNDISGLDFDPDMAHVVSRYEVPVIVMHIRGRPKDMQLNPEYDDLISDVYTSLKRCVTNALQAGVHKDKIVIDPGIGFGKTVEHNLEIFKRLREFSSMGYPILIGASRKSFIGKILDAPVDDRLEGSLAAVAVAIMNGANILRVHDVKPTVRAARLVDAILRVNNGSKLSHDVRKA